MTNRINFYKVLLEELWANENFKNCFIADPIPILFEFGIEVLDFVEKVEVHEDTLNLRNYVLPIKEQPERYMKVQNPIIAQVIKKTLADDAFKTKLLQNPKAGIKEVTGEDVREDLTICFYEDTLTVRHLVIPINPNNQQLNDSQLEMIDGGTTYLILSQPQPYIIGLITLDKF